MQNNFEEVDTPKTGCGCTAMLLGCLGVILVLAALATAGVWWAYQKIPDFARAVIDSGIRESDLLDADKDMLIAQIDRLVEGYKQGTVDMEKLGALGETLEPLVDLLIIDAAKVKYIDSSELTPEETADAEKILQRVTRGVIDQKISKFKLQEALDLISSTNDNGGRAFRDPVTDTELRAFLADCKQLAEDAEIPDQTYDPDVRAELEKLVDEALGENTAAPAGDVSGEMQPNQSP